jgi:hypothetical protein
VAGAPAGEESPVAERQETAICPPHHWLIDDEPSDGRERWSCQRCGLVRRETPRPAAARRLANVATLGRDEVALLDADHDAQFSSDW